MHHRSLFDLAVAAVGFTPAMSRGAIAITRQSPLMVEPALSDRDDDWLHDHWIAMPEAQFGDEAVS
ncbi:hypothetical protein [Acidiphilium sp.]|uniref:hypothetical protein n=1 Tax=Acidiphilium sp. TaxID=527 RepID=UPI003CFEBFB2